MEPFNPEKAWEMVEKIKCLLNDLTDYLGRYIDPVEEYDMDREYFKIIDMIQGWVRLAEKVSKRDS
jgi:hypothetical protein